MSIHGSPCHSPSLYCPSPSRIVEQWVFCGDLDTNQWIGIQANADALEKRGELFAVVFLFLGRGNDCSIVSGGTEGMSGENGTSPTALHSLGGGVG